MEKENSTISTVADILTTVNDINNFQYDETETKDVSLEEVSDSFPKEISDKIDLLYKIKSVKRAVTTLETELKNALAYEMQGKARKVGNEVVIGKGTNTYKPYDVNKVLDFLGEDWKVAVRPEFRTTAIKKIAEERGLNPYVIFDSLFETIVTGDISIVPESRAPKKYQSLNDGEEMNI